MTSALVLASASPRRQELLRNAGIPFVVQATNIPETPREGERPIDCAERLAHEKALAVFHTVIGRTVRFPETTVVGEPITTYASASTGAKAYRQLAREVLQRLDAP